MSYDIRLKDPVTKETIHFEQSHHIQGGTYASNGTTEAWLNITWNYGNHYTNVFGIDGIRAIYGKTGAESISILQNAINQLADNATDDYWESTEGNAKRPLYGLLAFAQMRPDGIWDGD